jgi:hypothetical protein
LVLFLPMQQIPADVKALFAAWGAKGGAAKTEAKKEAARKNGLLAHKDRRQTTKVTAKPRN